MNIKLILASSVLALGGLVACVATGDPMDDVVMTTVDNLNTEAIVTVEDPNQNSYIIAINSLKVKELTKAVEAKFGAVEQVVITQRRYIKNYEHTIPVTVPTVIDAETGETVVDSESLVGTIGGLVTTFFPPAAPFIPLAMLIPTLFAKRPRQHLVTAVKKAVPYDGKSDWAGAVAGIAKALGWVHSSNDAEELERVAKKLRVDHAAKNGELEILHKTLEAEKTKVS